MARDKKAGGRRKTETIKERAIYVYLPSEDMAKEWKGRAEAGGLSISKFVVEHVQNSLSQEEDPGYASRSELLRRLGSLEDENRRLSEEDDILKSAYARLEEELKVYRRTSFEETKDYQGARGFEKELVAVLKRKRIVDAGELLGLLGVDPKDTESVKAVTRELQNLVDYGFVVALPRGWRWQG